MWRGTFSTELATRTLIEFNLLKFDLTLGIYSMTTEQWNQILTGDTYIR